MADACAAAAAALREENDGMSNTLLLLAADYADCYVEISDELASVFADGAEQAGAAAALLDPVVLRPALEAFVAGAAVSHADADLALMADRFKERALDEDARDEAFKIAVRAKTAAEWTPTTDRTFPEPSLAAPRRGSDAR